MLTLATSLRGDWPFCFGGTLSWGLRDEFNDHVFSIDIMVILAVLFLLLLGCTSQAPEGIHHSVVVGVDDSGEGRVLGMEPKLFYRHFLHRSE